MRCENCQGIRKRFDQKLKRFVPCPACKGTGQTGVIGLPPNATIWREAPQAAENMPFTKKVV